MKKLLFLLFLLASFADSNAQCWQSANFCSGIKIDGSLWAWGPNSYGNFGNGTYNSSVQPIRIGTDTWKCVSGWTTRVGIKSDGTLWAWGNNYGGNMLGNSTTASSSNVPVQIGTDTDWKIVVMDNPSGIFCLALKTNGTLWAWGNNSRGQLGDGTFANRNMPNQIGTDTNWKSVSASNISVGIKTDGTLWEWGFDISTNTNRNLPHQRGTDSNWSSAVATTVNVFALKTNGTLWGWGSTSAYKLGDGVDAQSWRLEPGQIGTDTDWSSIGIFCAIKNNGTLWGWSFGGTLGGSGSFAPLPYPAQMGTDLDWVNSYDYDFSYSAKLKLNGNLWTVGSAASFGNPSHGDERTNLYLVPTTTCPSILPIIANNDAGSLFNGMGGSAVTNILSNDTYNNLPATFSNVSLTFISATNRGITLNRATGEVNVTANVPIGSYTLTYKICDLHNVTNCATATVAITVKPQAIDAITDNFIAAPINTLTGGVTPSVLSNDTLNGQAVNSLYVTTALINNGGILGATISSTGEIYIPAGTLAGNYTMSYRICSISNPTLCDNTSLKIRVTSQTITTPDIVYATRANNGVFQSALQSTGKIIISGGFTKYNNIDKMRFARLNTDLTLDTSFFTSGPIPNDQPAYEIAIQPDNKIIIVGNFASFNGSESGLGITRLNSDGTPDLTFNIHGAGFGSLDSPRCIAIQSDGKILVAGAMIESYNGVAIENMIRLNSDGSLDTTFNFHFKHAVTSGRIYKILVQPDGKIIVSGNTSVDRYEWTIGGIILVAEGQPNLFRLNSNGSIDPSFTTGITTTANIDDCGACISAMPIQNLLLQPDGKIIVVGIFDSYRGSVRSNIFRINSDGFYDSSFTTGTSANRTVKDAILEPSGKIVIAGVFTDFNGISQAKLARLNSNGSLDTSFSSGTGPTHNNLSENFVPSVYDLNRQLDGKIIVSGYFTHYNGISATNITRIAPEVAGGQAKNSIEYYAPEEEIDSNLDLSLSEIKIYPNPSNGIFTFDFSNSNEKFDNLTIYNTLGQIIYQSTIVSKTSNQINLSNLSSGTYIAKIHGENTSIQKILIKK